MRKLAAILVLASVTFVGQTRTNTRFLPVDDVRPGMRGVGRTVFEGTAIHEFQVEVLGVLKNVGPRQDLILARLSGGPLERTGVIQGMSGSPVYIDGRLMGAVAYAFPFAKEPIAGIQPIAQMIDILDVPATSPGRAALSSEEIVPPTTPAAFVHGMIEKVRAGAPLHEILDFPASFPASSGGSIGRIQTPLAVAGLTSEALRWFGPVLERQGFSVVQSGTAGGAGQLPSTPPRRLEPGSAVSAQLVRGDLDISANGTVTHVDGDKVYAFGHPFLSVGPLDLPMSTAYILQSLARLDTSSKIALPVEVVGAFRQDRATGIGGSMNTRPSMIPLNITLRSSSNTTVPYRFEVVNDRYLTPLLTGLTVINAVTASERSIGEVTLDIQGRIQLRNSSPVNVANISSGDGNGPTMASTVAMAPLQYLLTSGFDGALIERIDLEIVSTDRKTSATLEQIAVDRNEVRPGETVTLSAHLRGSRGEVFVERYPVTIPAGLPAGRVQLNVGDGSSITASELRRGATGAPAGLAAAVRELNKLRRNDRLYVKITTSEPGVVIKGEELPSLPPSLIALLDTGRSSSRAIAPLGSSTVSELEMPASRYVLQGQRTLSLTVRP